MKISLTDEQKRIIKRTVALAKSYKPNENKIYTTVAVEQGGGFDTFWDGKRVEISAHSGVKDIDYSIYYDLIYDILSDNENDFLEPFYEFDESWGTIESCFNFDTNTFTFQYGINYYESNLSEQGGILKKSISEELINAKNSSTNIQGNIFTMRFDGGGDSGYIEDNGENELGDEVSLPSAFTDIGYEVLENKYGGWENNEGSSGHITLDFSNPTNVKYNIEIYLNEVEEKGGEYDFNIKIDL
jgi:hypothetical protein